MVMVPGSVEDELVFSTLRYIRIYLLVEDARMFCTLKYIHDPQRNRLHVQHMTCCARG